MTEHPDDEWLYGQDGMCECGEQTWEMCDCGEFFLQWVCRYDPETGQCAIAGTADCDFDCPRSLEVGS